MPGEDIIFNIYQFTLQQIILERLIQVLKLPFQMNTHTYSWIIFDKALNHNTYNYFIKIFISTGY